MRAESPEPGDGGTPPAQQPQGVNKKPRTGQVGVRCKKSHRTRMTSCVIYFSIISSSLSDWKGTSVAVLAADHIQKNELASLFPSARFFVCTMGGLRHPPLCSVFQENAFFVFPQNYDIFLHCVLGTGFPFCFLCSKKNTPVVLTTEVFRAILVVDASVGALTPPTERTLHRPLIS